MKQLSCLVSSSPECLQQPGILVSNVEAICVHPCLWGGAVLMGLSQQDRDSHGEHSGACVPKPDLG